MIKGTLNRKEYDCNCGANHLDIVILNKKKRGLLNPRIVITYYYTCYVCSKVSGLFICKDAKLTEAGVL